MKGPQAMPLLKRIANDPDFKPIAQRAHQGKLVRADNVAEWFFQDSKDEWLFQSDFGALRLPFDIMWVEWNEPEKMRMDGRWLDSEMKSGGALLEDRTTPETLAYCETPGASRVVSVIAAQVFRDTGEILWYPNRGLLFTDDNGKYIEVRSMANAERKSPIDLNSIWLAVKPAFLAVSLMNCKNVTVDTRRTPVSKVSKPKRRRPDPRLEYHTIVLPERRQAGVRGMADAAGSVRPFHQVRGHFATYTAEAPLFGKHTGTYWKPWHTRGDMSAGEIRSDYEVKANA